MNVKENEVKNDFFPIMKKSEKFSTELYYDEKETVINSEGQTEENGNIIRTIMCRISMPETVSDYKTVKDFFLSVFRPDSILPRIYGAFNVDEETKQNFIDGILSIFAKSDICNFEKVTVSEMTEIKEALQNEKEKFKNALVTIEKLKNTIVMTQLNQLDLVEYSALKQQNEAKKRQIAG